MPVPKMKTSSSRKEAQPGEFDHFFILFFLLKSCFFHVAKLYFDSFHFFFVIFILLFIILKKYFILFYSKGFLSTTIRHLSHRLNIFQRN